MQACRDPEAAGNGPPGPHGSCAQDRDCPSPAGRPSRSSPGEPRSRAGRGACQRERGLAGELEQAFDAARGFRLANQKSGRNKGVAHGAERRLIPRHVEIQPVAEDLVAVRRSIRPEVPGNAQGADPGRGPGRGGSSDERPVKGRIVGCEGDSGISECLEVGSKPVESWRLAGDHRGSDVVLGGGLRRNRDPGVDEGVEEFPVAARLEVDADDGDLDEAVGCRIEARGFGVDDADHVGISTRPVGIMASGSGAMRSTVQWVPV